MKPTLLCTVKSLVVLPPLIVIERPAPSMVVLAEMTFVVVTVMVPSQVNVTVPPPDRAAFRFASVQLVTTPPQIPERGVTMRVIQNSGRDRVNRECQVPKNARDEPRNRELRNSSFMALQ